MDDAFAKQDKGEESVSEAYEKRLSEWNACDACEKQVKGEESGREWMLVVT